MAPWQAGAIRRDTMTELFRRGQVLPEGRSVAEEAGLIAGEKGGRNGTEKLDFEGNRQGIRHESLRTCHLRAEQWSWSHFTSRSSEEV